MKKNKGITLIALVITIIVLLILAGITINLTIGENGLINRTKQSGKLYKIAEIKENIEAEILALYMDKMSKGEKLTVEQALIDLNDNEIFEEIDLVEKNGVTQGYIVQLGNDENGNVVILEIEQDERVRIISKLNPTGYTNGNIEVQISVNSNEVSVTNIELPEGMTKKAEGIYEVSKNGNYMIKVTLNNGQIVEKKVKITTIDTLPPKDFTITATNQENGILINAETEDADETEDSACTGIEKYEYYYKLSTETEYKKNEDNVISGGVPANVYDIYVLAYDKAGNTKKSNIISITKSPYWNGFEITRLDKGYIDDSNTLTLYTGSGWEDSYAILKTSEDLHEYSKISITFSYTQGYTYGFGLFTSSGARIINGGSDASGGPSVDRETRIFDIPDDCDSHSFWFRACSHNAYLYIYNWELMK